MKQVMLIYNPASGDASFKNRLHEAVECFQRRHCCLVPVRTEPGAMIEGLVQEAVRRNMDGIVVAGGDGTLHAVVNAILLLGANLPFDVLPVGTVNDFAVHLKHDASLEACSARVSSGRTAPVDAGVVNGSFFINVVSAGLISTAAHSAPAALKNNLGKAAYYIKSLEALPGFRPLPMTIEADGRIMVEEVFMFVVTNTGTVGGFRGVAPLAAVADGLLDLLVVKRCGVRELMRIVARLLAGRYVPSGRVDYIQARRIRVSCGEAVVSDVDGEVGPPLPLDISLIPGALRVYC